MEAVNELRNQTLEVLSQPGTGRTYTHYFWTDPQGRLRIGRPRWKPHTASAPGKPPTRDTSELAQSIKIAVEGEDKQIVGTVGTDKPYGKRLEYGTSKMAARPWLRPSAEKATEKIIQIFRRKYL